MAKLIEGLTMHPCTEEQAYFAAVLGAENMLDLVADISGCALVIAEHIMKIELPDNAIVNEIEKQIYPVVERQMRIARRLMYENIQERKPHENHP